MIRTCPYCGTKIKHGFWTFWPERASCPTCGENPFQPVLKQLRTVRISYSICCAILLVLLVIPVVWHSLLPECVRWMTDIHNICLIQVTMALILVIFSPYYLTRDRHVQRMYEKEHSKENGSGK